MSNAIVLFHPGLESKKGDWNTGKHKRKLMHNEIAYVENDGSKKKITGYFWGEWEPQSEVSRCDKYYVHTPLYPNIEVAGGEIKKECGSGCSKGLSLNNTDPYVFGDRFIYSNCLQRTFKKLAELNTNDIIIFGSCKDGGFVLDTVFVVEKEYNKDKKHSDCFMIATGNLIDIKSFKIYKGKRFNENNPNAMYSFFPCSDEPFDRITLDLNDKRKKKTQGVCYIKDQTSQEIWQEIYKQVVDNGLKIGVWAKEPEKDR